MRREATYNRSGNRRGMVCGSISSLSLTPEAQLTVQDSPEFKAIMEEYYAQFPYMRADMEKKENILSGNSCAAIEDETEAEFTARMSAKEIEPIHHMPADDHNPDYFEMEY